MYGVRAVRASRVTVGTAGGVRADKSKSAKIAIIEPSVGGVNVGVVPSDPIVVPVPLIGVGTAATRENAAGTVGVLITGMVNVGILTSAVARALIWNCIAAHRLTAGSN